MNDFRRQQEIVNVIAVNQKGLPIHLIGCGAVGSWVGTLLARMGFENIHVYDFDTVEMHNLPNQAFTTEHIGMNKADALAKEINRINGSEPVVHAELVHMLNSPSSGYVFIMTDTIKSRKEIYASIKAKADISGIIETRISVDRIQVYAAVNDPDAYNSYGLTLQGESFNDETVPESACGIATTIATTSAATSAIVVRQFINMVNGAITGFEEVHASLSTFQMVADKSA